MPHYLIEEDLIPSQLPLKNGLTKNLGLLRIFEVRTLSDLNARFKNNVSMKRLSDESGISKELEFQLHSSVFT